MDKFTIVVDLDSTIIDSSKTVINLYNKLKRKNIKYIERHDWEFKPMISSREELQELLKLFSYKNFYDDVVVFPNAIETINKWCEQEGHRVIIVTKHFEARKPLTKQWVNKVMPKVELMFCERFGEKCSVLKSKGIIADIVIDDRIDVLENFKNIGAIRICYGNYMWNRESKDIRYTNWYELEWYLDVLCKVKKNYDIPMNLKWIIEHYKDKYSKDNKLGGCRSYYTMKIAKHISNNNKLKIKGVNINNENGSL